MAEYTIYKLHFTTPVHFGNMQPNEYSKSMNTIHSDTMYSAIISSLAKIGEAIPEDGDLGFTMSSLFPFYQKDKENKAVFFFPKPIKQSLLNVKDRTVAKKIKKISWLDKDLFEQTINGKDLFSDGDVSCIKSSYASTKDFPENFITPITNPRVKILRNGIGDAKPFYMERQCFLDYSGLFFLVKGDTSKIDKALSILENEGVGTDRNIGNGFFVFERDSISINEPNNAEYVMVMSMFIPKDKSVLKNMLKGDNVAYDLCRRGGWITTYPYNSLRKNAVYSFSPGSVFILENSKDNVDGTIVDLTPSSCKINHKIWRNGKSIFIPVIIK